MRGRHTWQFRVGIRAALGAIILVAALQTRDLTGQSQVPPAAGRSSAPPAATGLVMGTVVEGLSARPVAGALVHLTPLDRSVLADAQGRFVFSELPKGSYYITASKAGFISGSYGQRRASGIPWFLPLGDGERIGDLSVPIWKQASITGTITDEAGEPMIDVTVGVMARSVVAGMRRLTSGPAVKTDDRGVYRIFGLAPGEYFVAVLSTQTTLPQSVIDLNRQFRLGSREVAAQVDTIRFLATGTTGSALSQATSAGAVHVGDFAFLSTPSGSARAGTPLMPTADGRIFVYSTQFFPTGLTPAQASVISLQPGEERNGINLQLKPVTTARVSGVVTGPDGPLMVTLALVPAGQDPSTAAELETATSLSDADGHFTFLGVPAGQYVLRVLKRPPAPARGAGAATPTGPTLWAAQSIAVGATDILDLVVTLRTGLRVSGAVVFENAAQQPAADAVRRSVALFEAADGRPPVPTITRLLFDGAGRFSSYEMPPGRYYLRAQAPPPGWALKSAMLDGRDISDVPMTLDRSVDGVVLTFTNRRSELTGRVQNAAGAPDSTATVLIYPPDSARWTDCGTTPPRLLAVRVGRDATFRAAGLPAGDYLVVAIPDEAAEDALDARRLKALASLATSVTLAETEKRSLSLRTMAVPR